MPEGTVLGRARIDHPPHHLAVSPDGRQVWVTIRDSDQIVVLDAATRQVVRRLQIAPASHHVAFGPAGTHAYVVSAERGEVVGVEVVSGGSPHGFQWDGGPSGSQFDERAGTGDPIRYGPAPPNASV